MNAIPKINQTLKESILKKQLETKLFNMLRLDLPHFSHLESLHLHFSKTLVEYFDDVFKTSIWDETYDPDDIQVEYIGESNYWDYEVLMFGRYWYFMCETPANCEEKIVDDLWDNPETLFDYNPIYVCGCRKPTIENSVEEITYVEPDLKTDDVPLFDTDECPCCMEKWENNYTIKRNTYCGHPICMKCFEKCCEENYPKCPMCRKEYGETGDIVKEIISTHIHISEEITQTLFRYSDPKLFDLVNIEGLIQQSVLSDGIENILRKRFNMTIIHYGTEYVFGCEET